MPNKETCWRIAMYISAAMLLGCLFTPVQFREFTAYRVACIIAVLGVAITYHRNLFKNDKGCNE